MPHFTAISTTCTAATDRGDFCDATSLPDAPFPICLSHAAQVMRFLNGAIDQAEPEESQDDRLTAIQMPAEDSPIVYYLRIGEHIKVGYSANFTSRRRHYPPDAELLAIESGDRLLEQRRLRQFQQHKAMRREWFHPGRELMQHIEQLRAANAA